MTTGKAITKAVIPAAGLGTRFLPATKAMPKEMLPVVDRPAIQYVVEEAVKSGLTDLLMITGRNKRSLEDHFDREPGLERVPGTEGRQGPPGIRAVRLGAGPHPLRPPGRGQGPGPRGAVRQQHVGDEPFAVLLGDDLIDEAEDLLSTMMEVQQKTGGSVIALIEVDPSQISAYGCADITAVDGEEYVRVNSLVEKPAVAEAPSNLAVIGRYVLHPSVFGVLENTEPGRGGEIQLTDALQTLAAGEGEGSGVYGVVFKGRRFDTGDKLSYLKAVITLASERVEFGEDLKTWMKGFVN
jgi:UTP--glucose-1-phosphate uridylyltransferase